MCSCPEPLPHRVELRIVDRDERLLLVPDVEPEPLELLEAGRTQLLAHLDLTHRLVGEVGVVPVLVVEVHVLQEAAGMPRAELHRGRERHDAVVRRRVSAAEVDRDADADLIHDLHGARVAVGRSVDVHVQIDEAVLLAPCRGLPLHVLDGGRRPGGRRRRRRRRGRRGDGRRDGRCGTRAERAREGGKDDGREESASHEHDPRSVVYDAGRDAPRTSISR